MLPCPRSARYWLAAILSAAALGPSLSAAQASAEQWGIFELNLHGPSGGNPFTDVEFDAAFVDQASHRVAAPGFYDGNGIFTVRCMPQWPGTWTYTTHSNVPALAGKTGRFVVTPPMPGHHGPVAVYKTYHFAYADGTPYWPIGTTCYTWTHRPAAWEEQTLKTLAASPFNKLRMCVFPQDHCTDYLPPTLFPFEGTPPRNWNFDRFNPEFFRHLEKRIGQLQNLGIEADLILFHPYGPTWGFDSMDAAHDERYIRYLVARLAAYRNVWWSMANEYDAIKGKSESDWDRLFAVLRQADPYGHLRSIHNENRIYNQTEPWITHASIQDGRAVEEVGRAQLLRDAYRKPIVYDEVQYEGDYDQRWAQLSGQELVHRFWVGTVAGTYVGHGEYFRSPHNVAWIGEGGVLKGESAPRLSFLRKILEESPAEGIDPIDKWGDVPIGGQPGSYYLLYFGHEAPLQWSFELPAPGLAEGMRFRADVIDTWKMRITPVNADFVVHQSSRYSFSDRDHQSIRLPGISGIALRIRRIGQMESVASGKAATP